MRIDSSTVGMESARRYRAGGTSVRHEVIKDYRQNLEEGFFGSALMGSMTASEQNVWQRNGQRAEGDDGEGNASTVTNEDRTMDGFWGLRGNSGIRRSISSADRENRSVAEDLRQITIRYIFELLFAARRGQRERWLEEHGMTEEPNTLGQYGMTGNSNVQGQGNLQVVAFDSAGGAGREVSLASGADRLGNGVVRSFVQKSTYWEEEHASFSAAGKVKTSDGRCIDFQIDLSMSRSFEMTFQKEVSQLQKAMKDPLVINYDAPAAQVRDQKFYFDLDCDGKEEEISSLASGSGFLALDKNGDGRIGDGSELFGAGSGDGFRDLAAYDQDGNGWIDENDEIWSKLKIWTKDEWGRDVLYRLADKGVGAIYLGNVNTDFSLIGQTGGTEAMIRKTGLFLYESGLAGTIQHLDLATYQKEA